MKLTLKIHPNIHCYAVLCLSYSVMSDSETPWMVTFHVALLCPWNSLGKSTGVGCHALLQGIKPTSLVCPALQMDSLLLSHWEAHQ